MYRLEKWDSYLKEKETTIRLSTYLTNCIVVAMLLWILLTIFSSITLVIGDDFHPTPPMGWSSWNTFFGEINEDKVIGIADAIKRLKLDKFGYIYLTIDDFWNLPDRHPETQR